MTATAQAAPTSDRELVLTRIIDAPREKLFRAWTDPELLKQWFAPLPYTTPVAELDVRPGGANLVVMRSPDGKDLPNRGVYLEVIENERLVFTDAYVIAEAVHDGDSDVRGRRRQDALHRARASLDGRRPRGARKAGLPRRLGPVHRSACRAGGQAVRRGPARGPGIWFPIDLRQPLGRHSGKAISGLPEIAKE
jgi:uncharacterized protein YndB with AHSA1/START domain